MHKTTINRYCGVNSGTFSILNEQFLFTKNTVTEPCSTKPTTQALHKTTGVARHHIHVGLVCPWWSSSMALAVAAGLRIGDGAKCEPHLAWSHRATAHSSTPMQVEPPRTSRSSSIGCCLACCAAGYPIPSMTWTPSMKALRTESPKKPERLT